ncbi:zinc finger matrin-type protein 5 isoform X1 [Scaptodrosophila lebanonensis]|uniref:Zinc finger matrin-type protein 5 isoform X1 n=1 Tax=Drosophila lebanonensis TaxID=7225 RepID=A0A6J2U899_DROLE|nr:zinc finger matrin-type protein 5 isoform X1 [Scaptodrosophila lebanonensis]
MGGKSYYCDYCRCFMKNDLNVRKLHNSGLSHTVAKVTFMKQFEDPRKLLEEERAKIPCTRYFSGYCKFQLFCQYRHFSDKQLAKLEEIVSQLKKSHKRQFKKRQAKRSYKNLPPSLQHIDVSKLKQIHFETSWG